LHKEAAQSCTARARDAGSGQWLRKTGAAAFTGNPLADVSSTSYSYDKAAA